MPTRAAYLAHGPDDYDTLSLLCLAIGGTPDKLAAAGTARRLLLQFGGVGGIMAAPAAALQQVRGVGPATAARLHAALHLGASCHRRHQRGPLTVDHPDAAWQALRPHLEGRRTEALHALYLDVRNRVLAHRKLTVGSDRHTIVEPRQVLRPAVQLGAAGLILAHNHPSGDPTPSVEDLAVTERIANAAQVLGIALLDHLVIGDGAYVSLATRGRLPGWMRDADVSC